MVEFKGVFDLDKAYAKHEKLKRDDVRALMDWVDQQPHLPKINEHLALLFLHSRNYSNEAAKQAVDKYFTIRSRYPDTFLFRNLNVSPLKEHIDVSLQVKLPTKTPEGYSVNLLKLRDTNPEVFDLTLGAKLSDMTNAIWYFKNGPDNGLVLLFDMAGVVFSHVTRCQLMVVKKLTYYTQECCPIKLQGVHVINTNPVATASMAILKPFLQKKLQDMIHLHEGTEGLLDFIPKQCLPEDIGGELEHSDVLHERNKQELFEYADFFEQEDQLRVDESLRREATKRVEDYFGIEGTFKKLELD